MDISKVTTRMAALRLYCLTAGIERSPLFRFAISWDPRFIHRTAVTIIFSYSPLLKKVLETGF
jgi:hypothetical protein